MDKRPEINVYVLVVLLFLFIIPALIYYAYIVNEQQRYDDEQLLKTVTALHRGTPSERHLILNLLKSGIPAQTIFHDLYIKTSNDNFSQVDLVIATKVGIIVLEIKDYSGWIFGNGNQTNWTKVLAFGREKYSFYNPVKQNAKHIANLKRLLSKEQIPYYSVIVFYGNCQLREISFIPQGTYIVYDNRVMEVINEILNNNPQANYKNKREIVDLLKKAVDNGNNEENIIKHGENIENMIGRNRVYN